MLLQKLNFGPYNIHHITWPFGGGLILRWCRRCSVMREKLLQMYLLQQHYARSCCSDQRDKCTCDCRESGISIPCSSVHFTFQIACVFDDRYWHIELRVHTMNIAETYVDFNRPCQFYLCYFSKLGWARTKTRLDPTYSRPASITQGKAHLSLGVKQAGKGPLKHLIVRAKCIK